MKILLFYTELFIFARVSFSEIEKNFKKVFTIIVIVDKMNVGKKGV